MIEKGYATGYGSTSRDFIYTRVHNTRCIKNPKSASKMLAMFDLLLFFAVGSFLLRQGDYDCLTTRQKKT